MRTKTILLSAAVLAAGLSASVAQSVFSVNAVGYVNLTIAAGNNLIANPLNNSNNNINVVMPTVPGGTTVTRWNSTLQMLSAADTFLPPEWVDGDFVRSATVLAPGEAFFLNSPTATTITFVGEVPQGTLVNNISANPFSFVSSVVPQSATLQALGFPMTVNGLTVNRWNVAGQTYSPAVTQLGGEFVDGDFNVVQVVPTVGEGMLLTNPTGGAIPWTRTFSVN